MYYDAVTKEIVPVPQKICGAYPVDVRKRFVALFLASQPISERKFAEMYGINRKSLMKWLRVYEGISLRGQHGAAPAADKGPAPGPGREAGRKPSPKAGRTADREPGNSSTSDDGGMRTITIPRAEYLALLGMKGKFSSIRAICQEEGPGNG